jgi:hypothetical protein
VSSVTRTEVIPPERGEGDHLALPSTLLDGIQNLQGFGQ